MPQILEELAVQIRADLGNYEQTFQKAVNATRRLDSEVKRSVSGTQSLAAAERKLFSDTLAATGSIQKAAQAVDKYRGGLNATKPASDKAAASTRNLAEASRGAEGGLSRLTRRLVGLAAAYISFSSAIRLARSFVQINRELQDLEASLQTVTGSAAAARNTFRQITQFAAETPFEIKGLTEAFVRLQAFGAGPTIDQFRGLGNVAAAFSKDITTLTDAIVSAVNTSTEPIRAFGVQASIAGDKMKVSFNGVTSEIPRTTQALTELIASGGNTGTMAGAMERRMNTLGGAISNLQDRVTILARDIGNQGLNAELIRSTQTLEQAIVKNQQFAAAIGTGSAGAVRIFANSLVVAMPLIERFGALAASIAGLPSLEDTLKITRAGTLPDVFSQRAALVRERRDLMAEISKIESVPLVDRLRQNQPGLREAAMGPAGLILAAMGSREQLDAAKRRLGEVNTLIDQTESQAQMLRDITAKPVDVVANLLGGTDPDKSAKKVADAVAKISESLEQARREISAMAAATEGTSIKFDESAELAAALEGTIRALSREGSAQAQMLAAELVPEWIKYEKAVAAATAADKARVAQLKLLASAEQLTQDAIKKAAEERRKVMEEQARRAKELNEEIAHAIADPFGEALIEVTTTTKRIGDAVRNMVTQILADLQRILIRETITKSLVNAIVGSLGSGGSSGAGVGGVTAGDLFGHRQHGGPVSALTPYIVGEAGRELFVPASAGRIAPNHAMPTGGDTYEIHLHQSYEVRAIDTRDGAAFIRQMQPEIGVAAARAIRQAPALAAMVRREPK